VGLGLPPADHTPEYVDDLTELAASFTSADDRRMFLGDNARGLFGIPALDDRRAVSI
jgi:hypothetical protein